MKLYQQTISEEFAKANKRWFLTIGNDDTTKCIVRKEAVNCLLTATEYIQDEDFVCNTNLPDEMILIGNGFTPTFNAECVTLRGTVEHIVKTLKELFVIDPNMRAYQWFVTKK